MRGRPLHFSLLCLALLLFPTTRVKAQQPFFTEDSDLTPLFDPWRFFTCRQLPYDMEARPNEQQVLLKGALDET
jgi:hypothetical protein